jgi:murein DD-endopeptidase MepM/ murein hydrolase activator NlpD
LASVQRRRLDQAVDLGDEDPLYTRNVAKGPPDRRRVSLRWLAGSVLTGIFSVALVGGALQAAVGVGGYAIVRPALARGSATGDPTATAAKGDRFRPVAETEVTRRVIQISTVTRTQDRDIVRVRPFAHVRTNLAAPVPADIAEGLPSFNPIEIFAEGVEEPEQEVAGSDSIYTAEVDGEVAIKVEDFPLSGAAYDEAAELTESEVEMTVRQAAPFLSDGAVEVASLPYVDPARFEIASADPHALTSLAIAIAPENVSLIEKSDDLLDDGGMADKVLPVVEGASMKKMLLAEGATEAQALAIQSALVANFSFDFRAGQKVRLGLAPDESGAIRPVRVSLYEGERHIATVALSDTGTYVAASAPAADEELFVDQEKPRPTGALPSVYAGLWGTGRTLGMSDQLIQSLVRIFSYDVDYQSRLAPADGLEVIYSAEEPQAGEGKAEGSEILYAALTLGDVTHRFYRFRDPSDGSVDYFDESGKSAQKFLIRKPVIQARFTSPFGMRRHPILRRYRLHSGVDWAAPSGTPILAAGNAVVEKIGNRGAYGRSITLKHTNGYQTTYNHMSGYAKGLKGGTRVRQGQVIGYVGSTGLSTGPHLHFEVMVNGRFVDPMKIRLPRGRELGGAELASFEQERQRIDGLLTRDEPSFASVN